VARDGENEESKSTTNKGLLSGRLGAKQNRIRSGNFNGRAGTRRADRPAKIERFQRKNPWWMTW
jgi:hypothetical protein